MLLFGLKNDFVPGGVSIIAVLLFGLKNKINPGDVITYCNFIVRSHELNIPDGVSPSAILLFGLKNENFQVVCLLIAMLLLGLKTELIPNGVSTYCSVIA